MHQTRWEASLSITASLTTDNHSVKSITENPAMKAAYLEADKSIRINPITPVTPGPDQVRIQVAYCGVCGTDLHIYRGHMDKRVAFPQVIGHEMSGTIAEVGENVEDLKTGDAVVIRPLDPCGKCGACRSNNRHICYNLNFIGIDSAGAFQSSLNVPAHTVHKLPSSLDLKLAALIEPLSVACHDNRLGDVKTGETAVVLGGGPIGMLNAMVAKQRGAKVILSEINESRLALAQSLGFQTVNPLQDDIKAIVDAQTDGNGADVVFEVSGAKSAIAAMTDLACARGRIVIVAIVPEPTPVNLFQVFWRELQFIGARVYEPQDYEEAISLAASGKLNLDKLITAEMPLGKLADAFKMLDQSENQVKILVNCTA